VHPSQEKKLRHSMALGHELGSLTRFVDADEMRARGIPPAFLFGCTQHGGTLDPGKYVMGLRRAALRAGVRLFEQTKLLSYSEGPTITCRSEHGSARAPFMVLATNAYTPQLGLLRDKVVPLRVSAIETEPLSKAQLKTLGWQGRKGVTPHWTMESHRLTARDTLLVTTKQLGYAYGSGTPNQPDTAAYKALHQALEERFRPCAAPPSVRAGAATSAWPTTPCRWSAPPAPGTTFSIPPVVPGTASAPSRWSVTCWPSALAVSSTRCWRRCATRPHRRCPSRCSGAP
jgi:glycine/D-amino acid oxidase-like deaminating enzyme